MNFARACIPCIILTMQKNSLQTLAYFSIFWLWVLVFEPSLMQATTNVMHHGETSMFVALVTAAAIAVETLVWRSKCLHMRASGTFSDFDGLILFLWIGHILGSAIMLMVFMSALGLYNETEGFNLLLLLPLMTALVVKEIVLLGQLSEEASAKPPKYSLNVSNAGLLFATMIMHGCFWGLLASSNAPLHTYGSNMIVQIPVAALLFLMSYIPSRTLPFIEECTLQAKTKAGKWNLIGYTFITMILALKGIY